MATKRTTTISTSLPEDRLEAIEQLRAAINKYIDTAYEERLIDGAVHYVVPHSQFPSGYHCDPKKPLGYMSIVAQKNVISVHHMGLYGSKELMDWFVVEYPKYTNARLDMGKACVRFKNMEDIPYDIIGQLAGKISAKQWVELYTNALAGAKKK